MLAPSRTQRFSVVLLIELWERFGYYGMQALLLLFLVQRLGFADRDANLLWGAFAALTYAAPAIGGWLGDQVLGSRRAMIAGACCLVLGYTLLALPLDGAALLGLGMGTISVGNGLFKPNAANLVRRIYEGDDSRLDAAFTIYYMAVNIGSTVSLLASPWLKDRYGWHAAFAMSAVGLVIGLITYALLRRRLDGIGSAPDARPLPATTGWLILGGMIAAILVVMLVLQHAMVARACVWLAGLAILLIWARIHQRAAPAERPGLMITYLLTLEVMLFFIFYQQQSTSLTLFALRNVDPAFRLGDTTLFSFSPAQFQALNPIWIMILSPPLAWIYNALGRRGRDLPIAGKFLLGFVCVTDHGRGLQPDLGGRAAGQRPGAGHGGTLHAQAPERLHDGGAVRRHRCRILHRQRRRQPRLAAARPRHGRSRAEPADLSRAVPQSPGARDRGDGGLRRAASGHATTGPGASRGVERTAASGVNGRSKARALPWTR